MLAAVGHLVLCYYEGRTKSYAKVGTTFFFIMLRWSIQFYMSVTLPLYELFFFITAGKIMDSKKRQCAAIERFRLCDIQRMGTEMAPLMGNVFSLVTLVSGVISVKVL